MSTVYFKEISNCVLEPSFPIFIQECFSILKLIIENFENIEKNKEDNINPA